MSLINGIILSGGQSSRMATPKSLLSYHGKPQYIYLSTLLKPLCAEVFVSCKEEQVGLYSDAKVIADDHKYNNQGPITGIGSAMQQTGSALLVLGCDYPLVTEKHLKMLLKARDKSADGVVFVKEDLRPEPLIGIFEYRLFEAIAHEIEKGKGSVSKLIEAHNFVRIVPKDAAFLTSFDTPEQFQNFHKKADI